jgi:hypothetical protein
MIRYLNSGLLRSISVCAFLFFSGGALIAAQTASLIHVFTGSPNDGAARPAA